MQTAITQLPNSSGNPNLFNAVAYFNPTRNLYPIISLMGVSITPGAIVTTLIPNFPKSLAIGRVIALTAPFEAE